MDGVSFFQIPPTPRDPRDSKPYVIYLDVQVDVRQYPVAPGTTWPVKDLSACAATFTPFLTELEDQHLGLGL